VFKISKKVGGGSVFVLEGKIIIKSLYMGMELQNWIYKGSKIVILHCTGGIYFSYMGYQFAFCEHFS